MPDLTEVQVRERLEVRRWDDDRNRQRLARIAEAGRWLPLESADSLLLRREPQRSTGWTVEPVQTAVKLEEVHALCSPRAPPGACIEVRELCAVVEIEVWMKL